MASRPSRRAALVERVAVGVAQGVVEVLRGLAVSTGRGRLLGGERRVDDDGVDVTGLGRVMGEPRRVGDQRQRLAMQPTTTSGSDGIDDGEAGELVAQSRVAVGDLDRAAVDAVVEGGHVRTGDALDEPQLGAAGDDRHRFEHSARRR